LVAVSKTFPPEAVRERASGDCADFGENYVQEGVEKIQELSRSGPPGITSARLQSNKTRAIAEHFDWVHSIDRAKIAARSAEARGPGRASFSLYPGQRVGRGDQERRRSIGSGGSSPSGWRRCRA